MNRYALIKNNIVVNIVIWDGAGDMFADFKAVKDGNVWCTNQNLFQETMELGTMIEDIHTMLTSDDPNLDTLTYMHKLK